MSISETLVSVRKLFAEEVQALSEHVSEGRCTSFEEYKEITGRIRGLMQASDLTYEAVKRMNEDD